MNNRNRSTANRGFTLIELMIAIAVIAIISAIAMPLYSGYVRTAADGALVSSMSSIEVFQEDFRLRTGAYLTVAADRAAIQAAIGWQPQDDGLTTYSIAAGGGGYQLTGTAPDGTTVCMQYPAGTRC